MSDTADVSIAEQEARYRAEWNGFAPARLTEFLQRVPEGGRAEMLVRLLGAELEYAYQPPLGRGVPEYRAGRGPAGVDEDEERVRPSLQLFVLQFPELLGDSESLIRLAVLEYALRLRFDEVPPNPDSYLPLCPDAAERLYQLLRLTDRRLPATVGGEPRVGAVATDESTVRDDDVGASLASLTLPACLNCFLLLRHLGRGGMGYVYGAIDLRSAAQVAVKVMRRTDAWSVYRFMEEFSWLSRLEHPNLVRLYDAFHEDHLRYFSMEMVEGQPIRRWFQKARVRHPGKCWEYLRRILAQTASAIAYLHSQRVIHCDVKCSNVLITPKRRAVLLDMGLALREGRNQTFMGTLQYMAPELLSGGRPTQASDWYSFGMLLYEVITDDYPPIEVRQAEGEHPRYVIDKELLRKRLVQAECVPGLVDLCCALISRDPAERPDGHAVLRQLGYPTWFDGLESDCFMGRGNELDLLNDVLNPVASQEGRLVLIEGAAGVGKSCLVEHWLRQIPRADYWTVSIRCLRQDHTPLRVAHSIVLEFCEQLHDHPDAAESARNVVGESPELRKLFPQIRQLYEGEETTTQRLPSSQINQQTFNTALRQLRNWLMRFSGIRPIIFSIDDAHLGDSVSLEFLVSLTRECAFRGAVVMAVDVAGAQVIKSLIGPGSESGDTIRLALSPLQPEECRRLLNRWAGAQNRRLSESQIDEFVDRSCGNPFLLKEYFRELVEREREEADGTSVSPIASHSIWDPDRRLPIQSENVLQYLAILDEPITFHQLQMVSRIVPHGLQKAVNQLISSGWIRTREDSWDSHIGLAHDAYRVPILDRMPEDRRRRRHFRVARMLSSQFPPPWARMGLHYWESGHYREAAACYLQAALQARTDGEPGKAIEFLQRAEHANADRSVKERLQVMLLKAECLSSLGAAGAAAKTYDLAAANCTDAAQSAWCRALAGEQWIRYGELGLGLDRLRSVAGKKPVSALVLRSVWSRELIRIRILVMALRYRNGWPASPTIDRAFSQFERSLAQMPVPATFLDSRLGPAFLLDLSRLIRRTGSPQDRSLVLLNAATLLSIAGHRWHGIALRWYRQARQLSRETHSPYLIGQAHLTRAISCVLRGRFRSAARAAERSIGHFEGDPQRDQWELLFARWLRIGALWHQGAIRQLRMELEALHPGNAQRKTRMAELMRNVGPPFWSDLFVDDAHQIANGLNHAGELIAEPSFQSPRFFWWISSVYRLLYLGSADAAYRLLMDYWPHMRAEYLLSSSHYRWLAVSAWLCCNLVLLRENPRRRRVHEIRRWLRRMRRLQEPALAGSGDAFELALRVHLGHTIRHEEFCRTAGRLQRQDHGLMAAAVRVLSGQIAGAPRDLERRGRDFLSAQGCGDIDRTLDFVLPLPRRFDGASSGVGGRD